jgi:hypothetical protein
MQDCGVYALTVAYEVYRTVHESGKGENISFDLFVMPGHVALVIFDEDQRSYYLLSNDEIKGPLVGKRGDPEVIRGIAGIFGETKGLDFVVSPVGVTTVGNTNMKEKAFKRQLEERYEIMAAEWGLSPDTRFVPEAGGTMPVAEIFHQGLFLFHERARILQKSINKWAKQPAEEREKDREELIKNQLKNVSWMAEFFQLFGSRTKESKTSGVLRETRQGRRAKAIMQDVAFVETTPRRGEIPHPLDQFAKILSDYLAPLSLVSMPQIPDVDKLTAQQLQKAREQARKQEVRALQNLGGRDRSTVREAVVLLDFIKSHVIPHLF